jgi:hypothetical protein
MPLLALCQVTESQISVARRRLVLHIKDFQHFVAVVFDRQE